MGRRHSSAQYENKGLHRPFRIRIPAQTNTESPSKSHVIVCVLESIALRKKRSKYKAKLTLTANSNVLNDNSLLFTHTISLMIQVAFLSVFNLSCLKFDEVVMPILMSLSA